MTSKSAVQRTLDVPRMLTLLGIEYEERHDELWACCPHPDHTEHTPSWSIKLGSGGHWCFGCEKGGSAIDLVMWLFDFAAWYSAKEWIEEHGLYEEGVLPLSVKVVVNRPSFGTNEIAIPPEARFLHYDKWITTPKRYAEKRGVTPEQVARWGLGYACGGYYAQRLLLPTRTRAGRLINITGRAWGAKTPKYLNSKQMHGHDPSAIFGEQYWPADPSRSTLVLCEGELNALACERVGAMNVGALGGSTLEKEQVIKLSAFHTIILATDIDKAGSKIAEALRATLVRWRRCRRVPFPDKRDPNDLEQENPDLLRELLWGCADAHGSGG